MLENDQTSIKLIIKTEQSKITLNINPTMNLNSLRLRVFRSPTTSLCPASTFMHSPCWTFQRRTDVSLLPLRARCRLQSSAVQQISSVCPLMTSRHAPFEFLCLILIITGCHLLCLHVARKMDPSQPMAADSADFDICFFIFFQKLGQFT